VPLASESGWSSEGSASMTGMSWFSMPSSSASSRTAGTSGGSDMLLFSMVARADYLGLSWCVGGGEIAALLKMPTMSRPHFTFHPCS
jgi:hypothetical protein